MFDLEQAITNWRQQMLAAGIQAPAPMDELEGHLREEVERQMAAGVDAEEAFRMAVAKVGPAERLIMEFKKIGADNWNRPLAYGAWGLFVVSFFLPACADMWGWQCAGVSVGAWFNPGDFYRSGWLWIHLGLLTLSNLVMIGSAFLMPRILRGGHSWKWMRMATVISAILVWSYIGLALAQGGGKDLRIGAFLWATSFGLLCLAAFKMRSDVKKLTAHGS